MSDNALRSCARSNADGGGFAYIDKDTQTVKIRKGYFDVEAFIKSYHEILDEGHAASNPMLLHFRIATMGKVGTDNCHPFTIKDGALVHNGSFYWSTSGGKSATKSDTRFISERLHNILNYEDIMVNKDRVERAVSYNKVAMIYKDGKYVILNESSGHWDGGVWYSNRGYMNYNTRS